MDGDPKRVVHIVTDTGDTVMTVESIQREGTSLMMEGRMMGVWKSKMYLTVDSIPKIIRLLLNPSVMFFFFSFPFLYFREIKGKRQ